MRAELRAVVLLALLTCPAAFGDSWDIKDSRKVWKFSQGFSFVEEVDGARIPYEPNYKLTFKLGRRVLGVYAMHFDTLVEFPESGLFIGLSNTNFPGSAVAVFNQWGHLMMYAHHGPAVFDYCSETITRWRVWYDQDQPDLQVAKGQGLRGITLRNCRGERVNLREEVQRAYGRKGGWSSFEGLPFDPVLLDGKAPDPAPTPPGPASPQPGSAVPAPPEK